MKYIIAVLLVIFFFSVAIPFSCRVVTREKGRKIRAFSALTRCRRLKQEYEQDGKVMQSLSELPVYGEALSPNMVFYKQGYYKKGIWFLGYAEQDWRMLMDKTGKTKVLDIESDSPSPKKKSTTEVKEADE